MIKCSKTRLRSAMHEHHVVPHAYSFSNERGSRRGKKPPAVDVPKSEKAQRRAGSVDSKNGRQLITITSSPTETDPVLPDLHHGCQPWKAGHHDHVYI